MDRGRATQERGSLFRFVMDPALASGVGQPFRVVDFYAVVCAMSKIPYRSKRGWGLRKKPTLAWKLILGMSAGAPMSAVPLRNERPEPVSGVTAPMRHV